LTSHSAVESEKGGGRSAAGDGGFAVAFASEEQQQIPLKCFSTAEWRVIPLLQGGS
jgi:hypothetical protein